jgi:hypothetical protein
VLPDLQIVDPLATVASPNMQVSPEGMTRIGESPTEHGIPKLRQVPASQRNWVPAWQLAEPVENVIPAKSHVLEASRSLPGASHAWVVESHSPLAQRYSRPL